MTATVEPRRSPNTIEILQFEWLPREDLVADPDDRRFEVTGHSSLIGERKVRGALSVHARCELSEKLGRQLTDEDLRIAAETWVRNALQYGTPSHDLGILEERDAYLWDIYDVLAQVTEVERAR